MTSAGRAGNPRSRFIDRRTMSAYQIPAHRKKEIRIGARRRRRKGRKNGERWERARRYQIANKGSLRRDITVASGMGFRGRPLNNIEMQRLEQRRFSLPRRLNLPSASECCDRVAASPGAICCECLSRAGKNSFDER